MDQTTAYTDILRIKKKIRELNQLSCFYVDTKIAAVERYSDQVSKLKKEALSNWKPDWNRLPRELKYFYEKDEKDVMKKKRKNAAKPNLVKKKLSKIDLKTLESLDKEDENEENNLDKDEDKKSDKPSDDEAENLEDEENADEEDIEEGNDYIDDYFDNGENYGDDDGGGDDDEPVY